MYILDCGMEKQIYMAKKYKSADVASYKWKKRKQNDIYLFFKHVKPHFTKKSIMNSA